MTAGPDSDRRGQTGMIGYVLLIALALGAAILIVSGGSTVIDGLQQEQADETARITMEDVDARLSTLTSSTNETVREFSLGGLSQGDARLVRDGFVNVTVNRNATCATNVTLSSVRYENDEGRTVAYEAGGVWESSGNGTAMQTTPDIQFHNGSMDVEVVNLTGRVDDSPNTALYNATSSDRESERRSGEILVGDCARPNNVTVSVQSDFYDAWGRYLEGEMGVDVDVFDANRTARAYLNQSLLPRRLNDSRNQVVNMTDTAPYMEDVVFDDNTIRVSKNVSNQYRVYMEPLVDERMDIGQVRVVEDATNVTGPPLDVVFVMDESGSMADDVDESAGSKRIAAQEATKNFVGDLNDSKDRVGLVGYSSHHGVDANCAGNGPPRPSWTSGDVAKWIYSTDNEFLTASFERFNETVEETRSRCGTWGSAGLDKSNALLHLKSNQTRERYIIFLSDGAFSGEDMEDEGNPEEAAELRAETTGQQGAVLHTVGFGDDTEFNPNVLENMAELTGGEYHSASNQDQLNEVFTDIATRIASTEQIARTPTTTNISSENGSVFAPQITGDTDGIAVDTSDGREFLNVNDPTAPTRFSHAFAIGDNETVSINASTYECADEGWRGTGITRSHPDEDRTYQVTRCTDLKETGGEEMGPGDTTILRDGDPLSTVSHDPAWWQETLEARIDRHPGVSLTTDDHLDMESNQAIVVMDYPDTGEADNKLVLLYQIGRPESGATGEGIVNVRVRNVTVTN